MILWNWRVAIAGICWDFFFYGVDCCLAGCPEKKMIFGSGKSFFWSWRLAIAGIWWDFFFCGVRAKSDFGSGKSPFWSDCWDLLGFLLFCVVYCYLADCPEKNDFWAGEIIFLKLESGDSWDLLGFLLLRCRLLLGGLPGKKMIFGSGKSFFWSWRLAIAGIWWDFFFCGVRAKSDFWVGKITFLKRLLGFAGISPFLRCLLLLGRLPGKKWFLGRGNHFLKLENGDCWDLLGFLLLRCRLLLGGLPGKKRFLGRENHFSEVGD